VAFSRQQRIWCVVAAGVVAPLLVALAACGASAAQHTATPVPTSAQLNEHAAQGQAKFLAVGCAACHGDRGEGGIGPRSSGTTMRLEELQILVRSGAMNGARYTDDELTDQDVANIYLWLQTNPAG
jgi:mono/diheme cytochrome c family protein